MNTVKKLALGLALFLYLPLLLMLTSAVSFNRTVAKSDVVKQSLKQSGVYSALSKYILEQADKKASGQEQTIVVTSVKKTATPQALQGIAEPAVDNVYAWLNKPEGALKVNISVEPLKNDYINNVIATLKKKLAKLPTCSYDKPLSSNDPLTMNCMPPGTTPDDIITQAKEQLKEQNVFPADNNLALDSSKPASDNNLATPLKDSNVKLLSTMYRVARDSWPYLAVLTLLSSLAIIFFGTSHGKGLKRLGKLLIVSGLILAITSGIMLFFLDKFAGVRPGTDATIATTFEEAGKLLFVKMQRISLIFGIGYVVAGIIAASAGTVLAKKDAPEQAKKKDGEHIESEDLLPAEEQATNTLPKSPEEPSTKKIEKAATEALQEQEPPKPSTKISVK